MTAGNVRTINAKVTFVSRYCQDWKEIIEAEPSPDEVAPTIASVGGAGGWILQTYLFLRRRGIPVEISRAMPDQGVCIVHTDDVGIRNYPLGAFVVAIRPDRSRCLLCDMQIVQNTRLALSDRDFFVPYWPQPGLIPRDPSRGKRIERLGFVGRARNLASRFRTEAFAQQLGAVGLELVIREDRWWDYSDIDVVLGVRDGRLSFLNAKPASKLVNAWLAGAPALVGRESAFMELRKSELDFFEVDTPEDVLTALSLLKDSPDLFLSMIENGLARSEEFRADAITDRWVALLAGPVQEAFAVWCGESKLRHRARYLARCVRSRFQFKTYKR